ncbi:DNA gyrase inhibitor YacG [Sphingomonas jatrophae]|uniref:DNA gyrase inhibitor YacG n=1 Tax=Sphingomonas jatrophae TaxID=1166337 RepID=A0A1I6LKR9_9SPHN|nr:DNA gyrase inhibitor YacG [Sphingomonas jatrophae]SFS03981.1 hypothetical protein SAMN05192580_2859 [Sphingomonas jatrophae]
MSNLRAKGCPLCGAPTNPDYRPFCSRGCRDRDLLQWMGEGYRVPGRPIDEVADEED